MRQEVVWVNGRPVLRERVEVTKVENRDSVHDLGWLKGNGVISTLQDLFRVLDKNQVPFLFRTPGTPVRKSVGKEYILTAYLSETVKVRASTAEGLVRQALLRLPEHQPALRTSEIVIEGQTTGGGSDLDDVLSGAETAADAASDQLEGQGVLYGETPANIGG